MTSLRCHEWDIHQSYRRDRNAPPWIKVHRNIMSNRKWARLTDAEKGQLISIWVLAADKDGQIPHDALLLRKLCMLDDEPNLQKFIDLGLLIPVGRQDDVNVTPERRQNDAPEVEAEADIDKKKDGASAPTFWDVAEGIGIPRSLVGKLIGQHSENQVVDAIAACVKKRPADPKQFLVACLQDRPAKLFVPKEDEKLVPFAKANGLPEPGKTETYHEYRQRLWPLVKDLNARMSA